MNAYALANKVTPAEGDGLRSLSGWVIGSSILLVPVLAFIGFFEGRGSANIYANLPYRTYSLLSHLSWLPFLLAALIAEVLVFNRGWLKDIHRSKDDGDISHPRLFITEALSTVALWACAWWVGTVVGQVWEVRDAVSGFFVVLGMCALLAHLYKYLLVDGHDTGNGEMFGVANLPAHVVESQAMLEPSPGQQEKEHLSTYDADVYGMDESDMPRRSVDRANMRDKEPAYEFAWEKPTAGMEGLAGMQQTKSELHAAIKRFAHYKDMQKCQDGHQFNNNRNGTWTIADQNGILLSGAPGNGKTALAKACAAELNLPFVKIGCGDITSKWVNESPAVIKELFRQAGDKPSLVFMDEFDGVALSRSNGNMHGEDRKVVTALLAEIDRARTKPIVLIAATNFADLIDPAIARPGRFDFAIEIPYPDVEARAEIIRALLVKYHLIVDLVTLERVAKLWERRSVAFIDSTIKRLRETVTARGDFRVFMEDFKVAARAACRKTSAIPADGPKLSEIVLTSSVRQHANGLLYRLKNWEEIAERGGETPTGLILYGPPGTGKSMLLRSMARELIDWHVFEVHASEVIQNPKRFRDTVELAQTHRPSIVFLDEADELLANRNGGWNASATNEILKCMDGFSGKVPEVLFVAATNRLEAVDPAALRGGRFSETLFMDLLRGSDLVAFVQKQLECMPQVQFARDVTAKSVATLFGEAAPADVVSVLKKAVNRSFVGDCQRALTLDDFRAVEALRRIAKE